MSNISISAALASHLSTLDIPTQYENAPFTPAAGELYLAESLIPTSNIPMSIVAGGSNSSEGIYQVLVYSMAGETKGAGFAVADQVEALFERGTRLTHDGITVTILRVERNAGFMSGDRFAIPISVYYRAAT